MHCDRSTDPSAGDSTNATFLHTEMVPAWAVVILVCPRRLRALCMFQPPHSSFQFHQGPISIFSRPSFPSMEEHQLHGMRMAHLASFAIHHRLGPVHPQRGAYRTGCWARGSKGAYPPLMASLPSFPRNSTTSRRGGYVYIEILCGSRYRMGDSISPFSSPVFSRRLGSMASIPRG